MGFEFEPEIEEETTGEGGGGSLMAQTAAEQTDLVNLQMVLVTSSMNHEYTRKELERSKSFAKRQDLLVRLNHLKSLYFEARKRLSEFHPERLETIEVELRHQKQTVFSEHSIH